MSSSTGKIAFVHHTRGNKYVIYTVTSEGDSLKEVASGSPTFFDDDLNPTWLDNSHLFYTNRIEKKLFYLNVNTNEKIGVDPDVGEFYLTKVSPDKRKLALITELNKLYIINVGELSSGKVTSQEYNVNIDVSSLDKCFDWSPDSKYFVIKERGELTIYDLNNTKYKFIELDNFPANMSVSKIDWSF
jgi:hypothetical protein